MKTVRSVAFLLLTLVAIVCTVSVASAAMERITLDNADIVGAGATFPAPLYQRWIQEFMKTGPDFTIFYDAVGSGAGIKRFMAETVDFGASDAAMADAQMEGVKPGVQLIPATAGIIVLAYNLPGFDSALHLSREVYTDIFLGKIKRWDDDRIQALNPGLQLPRLDVVTVTRSDSSGTTWAFTNHLSAISTEWRDRGSGVGKKVDWPGNAMGGRYNEGVAVKIRYSVGSIGYVEYGIAKRAGLAMATLENRMGQYVQPDDMSGTVTLANTSSQMPPNLRMFIPDPDGTTSYPIVTYTWLLLYRNYSDPGKSEKVKQFTSWALSEGQKFASEYGYAPLPQSVAASALEALSTVH